MKKRSLITGIFLMLSAVFLLPSAAFARLKSMNFANLEKMYLEGKYEESLYGAKAL